MTTTGSLTGWEISEYLGPVSGQVVIGTGLFTDFFSGFTDLFGVQSRSYQKKLDRIHEGVMALLEQKARRLGANIILGLRVDHDEISGSGKSMLMVTASGTAARGRPTKQGGGDPSEEAADPLSDRVSAGRLKDLIGRRRVTRKATVGTIDWGSEDVWRFIIDHQVAEIAPHVLAQYEAVGAGYMTDEEREAMMQRYQEYFLSLPPDEAQGHLYRCASKSDTLWQLARKVIEAGELFDPERTLALLEGSDAVAAERALDLATVDQPMYSRRSIDELSAIIDAIRKRFEPARIRKKASMLGEKEVWQCGCGAEVKAIQDGCPKCGHDRYGVRTGMASVEEALATLEEKRNVLASVLQAEE